MVVRAIRIIATSTWYRTWYATILDYRLVSIIVSGPGIIYRDLALLSYDKTTSAGISGDYGIDRNYYVRRTVGAGVQAICFDAKASVTLRAVVAHPSLRTIFRTSNWLSVVAGTLYMRGCRTINRLISLIFVYCS